MSKIAIVGSFVLGGVVGFFIGKKVFENYYKTLADEEIESVKAHYRLSKPNTNEKNVKAIPKSQISKSSIEPSNPNRPKINYNLVTSKENTINEKEKSNEYEDDEEATEEDDEGTTEEGDITESENDDYSEISNEEPYMIDSSDFANTYDKYDKISLYYYIVNGVLVDEDDEIIDDIERTVGQDNLDMIGYPGTIWIRNERLRTDYEICSINQAFDQEEKDFLEDSKYIRKRPISPREEYNLRKGRRNENEETG